MGRFSFSHVVAACAALLVVVGGLPIAPGASAQGATVGGVIINEVMYHALEDAEGLDDPYDFVELTNTGTASVDLTGWSFTDAFDLTLGSLTIEPGGFVVIAADATAFAGRYGTTADAAFSSDQRLSNGSETVELRDAAGDVVDAVTYSDDPPWVGTPDGDGPSLERLDPALVNTGDNADAPNWLASLIVGGTPGAENSVAPFLDGPTVSDVGHDDGDRPEPDAAVRVDAVVTNATTVTVTYRTMFDGEISIPMLDDAASAGGADDGVYSALLPGQPAGTLVRYRVVATGPNGVSRQVPALGDSINYVGYVVSDPALASALPIIEWFMADEDYDDMLENHRFDDVLLPAVIAYDGDIWDNAQMRVRGDTTRVLDKPNFKIELPAGYLFEIPGHTTMEVDEFNLQWQQGPVETLAWNVLDEIGFPRTDYFLVRSHRNGEFWGVGAYLQAHDGRWRDTFGYGDDAFYRKQGRPGGWLFTQAATPAGMEAQFDKSEREDEDYTDIWELAGGLKGPPTAANEAFILDNIDIPNAVNYMAFVGLVRHWDSDVKNFTLTRDVEGTGRWQILPWDLDLIMRPEFDGFGTILVPDGQLYTAALLQHPEFKKMYGRRLRTLIDTYPFPDYWIDTYDAIHAVVRDEWEEDFVVWGQGPDPLSAQRLWAAGVNDRRRLFSQNTGGTNVIPRSQIAERPIVISEIKYAGDGPEFVELTNTHPTEAFDLSGWELDGVGLTLPPGTVILAGETVVFTSDDAALRDAVSGVFIAGEFPGSLSDAGETLTLIDSAGAVVDEVTYGPSDPWPWTAAYRGLSLELIDLTADNDTPAAWAPSSAIGGSPGSTNDPDTAPLGPPPTAGLILNEFNAVGGDRQLDDGDGSDPTFGTVDGNGGDWFELVVVEDGLDVRGWTLEWSEEASSGALVLSDNPLWASLPAGTIITIAEDQPDDLSIDPFTDDWSINVRAHDGGDGSLITATDFDVTNDDWQLVIRDRDGFPRFGPAGEGVGGLGGVNSREVGALLDDPSASITPESTYDDLKSSTFGLPNDNDGDVQDFSALRVLDAPTVTDGPNDVTVAPGDSATFSVSVTGTAPFTYQWRIDGTPVPGATDPALTISDVGGELDGASIDVVVENPLGSTTSAAASLTIDESIVTTADGGTNRPAVTATATPGRIVVDAEPVGSAGLFQMRWRTTGAYTWTSVQSERSWVLDGVENEVPHRIEVRALVGSTWGDWTAVQSTPPAPSVPTTTSTTTTTTTTTTVSTTTVPTTTVPTTTVPTTTTTTTVPTTTVPTTTTTTTTTPTTTTVPTTTTTVAPNVTVIPGGDDRPAVILTARVGAIDIEAVDDGQAQSYQMRWTGTDRRRWTSVQDERFWSLTGLTAGVVHTIEVRTFDGAVWGPWTVGRTTPLDGTPVTTTTMPSTTTTAPPATTTTGPSTTTTAPPATVPTTTTTTTPGDGVVYEASGAADRPALTLTVFPTRIEIVADPPPGTSSHQMRWQGDGSRVWTSVQTSTTWTLDGLDSGALYVIEVRSLVGATWGPWTRRSVRTP